MFILIILLISLFISIPVFAIDDFTHESEFSSISSRGNSPYESYLTKTCNRVIYDKMHDITFGGHYSYGTISDAQIEIARNWDVNTKYLTAISKKTYVFLGGVVEGNQFAGFSERNNIDLGLTIKYINRDNFKIYLEYGFRHTVELPIGNTNTRKDQKLRFLGKVDKSISTNASYGFWVEYIPNLTTPVDYMVNFEPSLRVVINSIFSLKVAYKGMYDNRLAIASRKYYDETYRTSLLAKF